MSEISAWHDATRDTDALIGPEYHAADSVGPGEAGSGPASTEADLSIEAELEAALAMADADDRFDSAPTEPVLLLADHSGEDADVPGHDELEHGIASVIASLYADSRDDSATEPADETDEADEADPLDDAITFRLLSELDRLWHRAA